MTASPLTTPPSAPPSVAEALARARAARDAGMAQAEAADLLGYDRAIIDQAIVAFAELGQPFSANNLRDLLPDVRTSLLGSRFYAASCAGTIVRVGVVPSTKENTHHKPIELWLGAAAAERVSQGDPLEEPNPAVRAAHRALEEVLGPVSTAAGNMRRWRVAYHVAAATEAALAQAATS